MRHPFLIILALVSMVFQTASSCVKNDNNIIPENNNMTGRKINVKINSQTFTATLQDNNTARAFGNMLPLTINMIELNGNEKYYDLASSLPANSSNPGVIENGDLMLYGTNTLVLFYKSFSTSYSYTKLATVDDVTGLASTLGSGNVTVTYKFE